MFRSRTHKIWGDIWSRKGRTILVSLAIFIGVAGTIALSSMGDIIIRQLRQDIQEDDLAMLTAFVSVNAEERVDNEAYLEHIRETDQIEGLTDVIGFVSTVGYFQLAGEESAGEAPGAFIEAFVTAYTTPYDPEEPLPIEPLRMLTEGNYAGGRYPEAGKNEVVLEQRMAKEYNLNIGDTIEFRILSPSRSEGILGDVGTVEEWTISGIVFHPYAGAGYVGGPPDVSIYATLDDANYITGTIGLTGFLARFEDFDTAKAQETIFTNFIARETPYRVGFTIPQDPANNQLIQGAQNIAGTMSFLAMVALVVSGFLVVNVISAIVVEQKRQIGVMKSLGASRWDNFAMYAGIAFMYGLIGVIPGVLIGVPGGNAAAHALAPTTNTLLEGFKTSPPSILTGVLIGLLVPVLASIIPVWFGTRVKILDAMTDLGIDAKYGSGPIARVIGMLPIPITMRQGLSNISLKKSRLALTVVTLSIAAGAFMGIWAVFSSFTSSIASYIDLFNVEVGIAPNESRTPDEIIEVLRSRTFSLPAKGESGTEQPVDFTIELGFQLQVKFEGYDPEFSMGGPPGIIAYGYDVTSESPAFNVTVSQGEMLTEENAGNGVVFSSMLASNMGKTVGDTAVLIVPGSTAELTIVGISDFPIDQIWIDWRTLAEISGYTTAANVDSPQPIPDMLKQFDIARYITEVGIGKAEGEADAQIQVLGLSAAVLEAVGEGGDFFSQEKPGIFISQTLANRYEYELGDIWLTSTANSGDSRIFTIAGIVEEDAVALPGLPDEFIGMFWQDIAALDGVSLEGTPLPQFYFLVTTLDNPSAEDLEPFVDAINETMLDAGVSAITINFVEIVDSINEAFVTIQVILQAVAFLIALVGALGLLTTLSMSVFERQKEIGVMRSIGASSGTVAAQFLTEGLVTGFIAWLVGIPLAYLIQVGLLKATGFGELFPTVFSVSGTLIGLVGMLGITIVASLWPSISAARKTVSEVLRYQ